MCRKSGTHGFAAEVEGAIPPSTVTRALRFGVLWRKRSLGTASTKGNRWVERILSLRETCRLRAKSTYTVLVEAMTSLFHGQPPALSWINAGVHTAAPPR